MFREAAGDNVSKKDSERTLITLVPAYDFFWVSNEKQTSEHRQRMHTLKTFHVESSFRAQPE